MAKTSETSNPSLLHVVHQSTSKCLVEIHTSVLYKNKALSTLTLSWAMPEFAKCVYDSSLDVTTLV